VLDACQYLGNGTALLSELCENNGVCGNGTESPGRYDCDCAEGYTGPNCRKRMSGFVYTCIYHYINLCSVSPNREALCYLDYMFATNIGNLNPLQSRTYRGCMHGQCGSRGEYVLLLSNCTK